MVLADVNEVKSPVGCRKSVPLTPTIVDFLLDLFSGSAHVIAELHNVAALGRSEGDLNLARALLREGRLDDAATALRNAADKGAYPWSVAWFSGLVNFQKGEMDAAIERFERILDTNFAEARRRGFDFSYDYRVRNQLALALFERAKHTPPGQDSETQLHAALGQFKSTLTIDPENATAHYGLAQVYASLGNEDAASHHRTLHEIYRPDDTAPGEAVQIARRRNPAANHAANALANLSVLPK